MKAKFAVAAILASIVPAVYADPYVGPFDLASDSFYSNFIEKRLSVGLSYANASMKETSTPHEKSYLGNLDTLKEDSTSALGLVIRYDFCDYVALEFANDFSADLKAYNYGHDAEGHESSTDGTLKLSGYRLQLLLQYPVDLTGMTDFTDNCYIVPYVGLGFCDVSASWSYASWWHWGWSSPEDYDNFANGSQSPRNGYSRWMLPEDPGMSFVFSVGIGLRMFDHLGVDLVYRHISIDDVEADFRTGAANGHLMKEGAFPAECDQFSLMARYVF